MARQVTVKINGKDVWESFGLDIISVTPEIMGMPELESRGFEVIGRDGSSPSISGYKSRRHTINGIMVDTTHANLLSGLKDLKQEVAGGHHGRYRFRITFADDSNVYYLARMISMNVAPIGPRFKATEAQISLTIILEDAVGLYDTFTLTDLGGSPFTSPYSSFFQNAGSAIMRPRILLENVEAGAITDISIINVACRNRLRSITPSGGTAPTRQTGRWGDVAGAAGFTPGGSNNIQFASQGNFNPGCFSFLCLLKPVSSGNGMSVGYLFSTTGNTIKLYHSAASIIFDVNGTTRTISDATSGLTIDEWFAIGACYNGANMRLRIYRISTQTDSITISTGVTYRGIPTTLYIGSDASGANNGYKHLDDIRFYSRPLTGFFPGTLSNDDWTDFRASTGPIPIERLTSLYLSFDYKLTALGYENTQLDLTPTVAQNKYLEIKCDEKDVYLLADAFESAPASQMASVSGEFPFFVPGYNGIQVIHDGDASSVNMAIADERRYL